MQTRSAILLLISALAPYAQTTHQQPGIVARVIPYPPLSPDEVSRLETEVQTNPADIATRLRLLRHYSDTAPGDAPSRSARLRHILYIIENHPADPAAGSSLAYVPFSSDPGDHTLVRSEWLRAADSHPKNTEVQLNAACFLHREHPKNAEELLSRFLSREPSSRVVAANLGFFYAMDILGLASPDEAGGLEALAARAKSELERTDHPLVLAGAGTALPNLFMQTKAAMTPTPDRSAFELSAALMARARQLAPDEPELKGPMPLIREFQEFRNSATGEAHNQALPPMMAPRSEPGGPASIRVGADVQAAKLTEKPELTYPDLARQARIQGMVRFNAIIATDGTVENLQLISGHPLLVPAATDVVRRYRYQPTLLNGSPVKVVTQVDVPFTLSQ